MTNTYSVNFSDKEPAIELTHPHFKWVVDLDSLTPETWFILGEATSKCGHLARTPMTPEKRDELYSVLLIRGAVASAAIEGNTMTEEEIKARITEEDFGENPDNYYENEVSNILSVMTKLLDDYFILEKETDFSPELINEFNLGVLNGVAKKDVVPGEYSNEMMGVGDYRSPRPEDFGPTMDMLCAWLNGTAFDVIEDEIARAIIKAIYAHIYFVWIHAYGDGNGRTARIIEAKILIDAGIPTSAVHLFSNHYNKERSSYYGELDKTWKSGGDVSGFVLFALKGFVVGLKSHLNRLMLQNNDIFWSEYIHSYFDGSTKKTDDRRRKLLLGLPMFSLDAVEFSKIKRYTPTIANAYAGVTDKTLKRDLKELENKGLIVYQKDGRITTNAISIIIASTPKNKLNILY